MKYDEARQQIKSGDLLAWSHGGWTNWHGIQVNLVRMFTRSEYSHIGLALVGAGRVFVIEAVGSGVRLFPLSRELPCHWIRRPRELCPAAVDFAFDRLGDAHSRGARRAAEVGTTQLRGVT